MCRGAGGGTCYAAAEEKCDEILQFNGEMVLEQLDIHMGKWTLPLPHFIHKNQ